MKLKNYLEKVLNPTDFAHREFTFLNPWKSDEVLAIVVADDLQEALEIYGEYVRENHIENTYSLEELEKDCDDTDIQELFFGVNGGEYYIALPDRETLKDDPITRWETTICYETWNYEATEAGETDNKGIDEENGYSLDELLHFLDSYQPWKLEDGWLATVEPEYNRDYTEDTYRTIHIDGADKADYEALLETHKKLN